MHKTAISPKRAYCIYADTLVASKRKKSINEKENHKNIVDYFTITGG